MLYLTDVAKNWDCLACCFFYSARLLKVRTNSTNIKPLQDNAAPLPTLPSALANFDVLPDSAHVRLPVVCALLACSPATVWRRVKNKVLPPPRKLSEKIAAWSVADLRKVLRGEGWK